MNIYPANQSVTSASVSHLRLLLRFVSVTANNLQSVYTRVADVTPVYPVRTTFLFLQQPTAQRSLGRCQCRHPYQHLCIDLSAACQAIYDGRDFNLTSASTGFSLGPNVTLSVTGLEPVTADNTILFFSHAANNSNTVSSVVGRFVDVQMLGVSGEYNAVVELTQFGPANEGQLFASAQTSCCSSGIVCESKFATAFADHASEVPQTVTVDSTIYFLVGEVVVEDIVVDPSSQVLTTSQMEFAITGSGFQACDPDAADYETCLDLLNITLDVGNGTR